jgi:nitrogenase molybdenum-iron protein beta chain
LNIIPGIINPGDLREIKEIFDLLGVSYTILSDISDTLDAPIILPKPPFPDGGTSVDGIRQCTSAFGVISLCEHAGGSAALFLKKKYGMRSDAICPIGVSNTDRFIEIITDMTDKEIPYELEKERGRLIDVMVDVHQLTYGKKAAIFADPDIALGIAEFTSELGMGVVVLASSTSSKKFAQKAKEISDGEILNGNDLYDLHLAVKERDVDILFGHTMCKKTIGEDDIAFVRCGFPVYDRVGYHRYGIMGYRGGIYLTDLIANAILEWEERS